MKQCFPTYAFMLSKLKILSINEYLQHIKLKKNEHTERKNIFTFQMNSHCVNFTQFL